MLVLSRKEGEKIMIGDNVVVTIVRVHGERVRVGIEAPPQIHVVRSELIGTPKGLPPIRVLS